jgi:hypothetical protein
MLYRVRELTVQDKSPELYKARNLRDGSDGIAAGIQHLHQDISAPIITIRFVNLQKGM